VENRFNVLLGCTGMRWRWEWGGGLRGIPRSLAGSGGGEAEATGGKFGPCLHALVATCCTCVRVCKELRMFCLEIMKCFCKEGQGAACVLPQLGDTVVCKSNSHIVLSAQ